MGLTCVTYAPLNVNACSTFCMWNAATASYIVIQAIAGMSWSAYETMQPIPIAIGSYCNQQLTVNTHP